MAKDLLDASILIHHWYQCRTKPLRECSVADAEAWAEKLIALEMTKAIVTPVYIELLCGVSSSHEGQLTRAYLNRFQCVDGGHIPREDWEEAIRLAQRIPVTNKPRQLGDCLIKAIAKRLHYRVRTRDKGFPR